MSGLRLCRSVTEHPPERRGFDEVSHRTYQESSSAWTSVTGIYDVKGAAWLWVYIQRLPVAFEDNAHLHHKAHTLEQSNVVERVAVDSHDVGKLAGRDAPEILVMFEQLGGVSRGCLDRKERRQSHLHHELEFVCVLAMRINPRIGSECDLDSGFVGAARGTHDERSDSRGLRGHLRGIVSGNGRFVGYEVASDDRGHVPGSMLLHELHVLVVHVG